MKEGWKDFKLKELLEIKYGKDHKKLKDGKYPLYGSGGIMRYVEAFLYDDESILIPRKGTLTNLFYLNAPFSTVDTMFWSKIDKKKVFPKFLYYLLKTYDLSLLDVGAAIPSLTTKVLKEVSVKLPPLPTQQKIASILSSYDDLIENNLKRIKLLEEKAQQTYEEWFVRMKFPGYENVDIDSESGLPLGWEGRRIGDFVKTSSGGTPSKKKEQEYYNGGTIPWVKTGELKNFMLTGSKDCITESGLAKSSAKLFPANTVLLAMYGNTIGETSFVTIPVSTNQACCAFLVEDKEYLSYFIHQYLLYNKEVILNHRMGAAQENVSQTIIKNIKLNLPTEPILELFGSDMKLLYSQIENTTNQNQLLKEARDILLPRLMSGMIDVEGI